MVEVLDEAEAEIRAAAAWYDDRRNGLGERFLDAVEEGLERLEAAPLWGAPWSTRGVPEDTRRVALHGFPYRLVYVMEPRLVVVAVAHERQRPGYWWHRLGRLQGRGSG